MAYVVPFLFDWHWRQQRYDFPVLRCCARGSARMMPLVSMHAVLQPAGCGMLCCFFGLCGWPAVAALMPVRTVVARAFSSGIVSAMLPPPSIKHMAGN